MSIAKIWVVAEVVDGAPTTTSLELVSHARTLADTVEAVVWGDGASAAGDPGRVRRHHRPRRGRSRRSPARRPGGRGHRRRRGGRQRARTPSCCPPPTTAGTSPAACRSSSTARC